MLEAGAFRAERLLADDFDEDAVREGVGAEEVNDAVAGEAAEHGRGVDALREVRGGGCGSRRVALCCLEPRLLGGGPGALRLGGRG